MSTALAIASVTAVLKDLLDNGMIDHHLSSTVGDVTVSALPPDRIDVSAAKEKSQLNLFLYQITPNQGWRNVGLPASDGRGERISNPPLALNLHYLLTAYGAEEFHAEILLGYGMQLLHETPVLTREAIRRALAPPTPVTGGGGLPPAMQSLFTSELADQVELIKISPLTLTTEEISKMWAAFQAKYRPTAAYQASVVLIESRRSTRSALPVRDRLLYVVPFRQPVIQQIKSQRQAGDPIVMNQPILVGYSLVIVGQRLRGEDTRVAIGGIEVTPQSTNVSDTQVSVSIPAALPAGVQGVQVVHRKLMGSPPTPHRGVESNVAAFVLHPRLIAPVLVSNLTGAGSAPRSADLVLTVEPAIGPAQQVVLLLNELVLASPPASLPQAYRFVAPSRFLVSSPPASQPQASTNITIPISNVQAGTYLVRVQVDGAESPLEPATGPYTSPQVTIP